MSESITTKLTQAMVLSAGRGERLRPFTDTCPKPLLEIGGQSLLMHQLRRLHMAGFERVVINLGWLGEQIPQALASKLDQSPLNALEVIYSQEPSPALETAGGIRHALHLFEPGPLAVISADAWCDLDYAQLAGHELQSGAHLILVSNPPHHPQGDFVLESGQIVPLISTQAPRLTYSGLGIFSTDLFASLEPGHRPLRPVLEQAINDYQVTGEHFAGQWSDIGTPKRLQLAQQAWPDWPNTQR